MAIQQINRERLATALRERMEAAGENQTQFASRLGLSQSVVSELLNGKGRAGLTMAARAILQEYPDLLSFLIGDIGTEDSPNG